MAAAAICMRCCVQCVYPLSLPPTTTPRRRRPRRRRLRRYFPQDPGQWGWDFGRRKWPLQGAFTVVVPLFPGPLVLGPRRTGCNVVGRCKDSAGEPWGAAYSPGRCLVASGTSIFRSCGANAATPSSTLPLPMWRCPQAFHGSESTSRNSSQSQLNRLFTADAGERRCVRVSAGLSSSLPRGEHQCSLINLGDRTTCVMYPSVILTQKPSCSCDSELQKPSNSSDQHQSSLNPNLGVKCADASPHDKQNLDVAENESCFRTNTVHSGRMYRV
jgi:hypothetical protein